MSDAPVQEALSPELAELSERVRRLIATTLTMRAPAAALREAVRAIDAVERELRAYVTDPPPPRYPGATSLEEAFPYDPVCGRFSPLAPPVVIEWRDPLAIGNVTFATPYEGPPGCVHGGVIAATFDQVLNAANLVRGLAGPTRQLDLTYRRPTPLGQALRFEGWQERVEGREIHTRGRLLVGDQITVEARGVFVKLSPERVMRLLG